MNEPRTIESPDDAERTRAKRVVASYLLDARYSPGVLTLHEYRQKTRTLEERMVDLALERFAEACAIVESVCGPMGVPFEAKVYSVRDRVNRRNDF